ncbi:Nucleic acid-binding protein [Corchorus capsularis]|uniref:Nucleic acid-binding protein n=1 Tax=Corchorus capsularis TaxID=210143 RepID=A0A1R3JYB6_COCAP|nr:Nucleic acid-binding protein [Corchorus capsularis]
MVQQQGALSQEALFDSAVESTIKDLLSLNLANIGSAMFKIQARILDIDTSDGWYYPSCPICTTSMAPELDAFYCKEHQRQPPHLTMKLSLYIGDNTAKTKAIIFGILAEKMSNINVVGMPILGDISSVRLPNIAETILNKEYNFVVGLSDEAFRQELLNYKIFAYKAINETQSSTCSSD